MDIIYREGVKYMKAVKCDICGKILDVKKESLFFEIHRLYKLNP